MNLMNEAEYAKLIIGAVEAATSSTAAKYQAEIDHLKAQLAMQADELTAANEDSKLWDGHEGRYCKSLNATAEDVAKYKAEIEKSVLETMVLRAKGCGCVCGLEFDLRKELEV